MKKINPIGIWYNGQTIQANYLQLFCANDNLIDTAVFNYVLIYMDTNSVQTDVPPMELTKGQMIMTGADYDANWNTIDQAWNWIASKMNITFI